MEKIIEKVATTVIKVFVLYVFIMAAFLALILGVEKPVLGVGFMISAVFLLKILEFGSNGGDANDSGRNEDGT
ncbi:hypothetical protein K413DRAFT_3025 [Clostridium sp. ASBs410]|nr:hypothetical protein K413DRAFT_3025 [Clostridium sp. ASBs410]